VGRFRSATSTLGLSEAENPKPLMSDRPKTLTIAAASRSVSCSSIGSSMIVVAFSSPPLVVTVTPGRGLLFESSRLLCLGGLARGAQDLRAADRLPEQIEELAALVVGDAAPPRSAHRSASAALPRW
jgi:hypothetical protein